MGKLLIQYSHAKKIWCTTCSTLARRTELPCFRQFRIAAVTSWAMTTICCRS